jgi:hypothetical protein
MSSTRITAALRDHVIGGLMRHRFNIEELAITDLIKQADQLEVERKTVGYETVYSASDRETLSRKPSWFPCVTRVKVQIEEGAVTEVHFSEKRPVPYDRGKDYSSAVAAIIHPDCAYLQLSRQEQQLRDEAKSQRAALEEKRRDLRARAVAVIESVTTVKRLLEVWPEVHDFLPEENAGPQGNLPTVLIEDLNQALGLKTAA